MNLRSRSCRRRWCRVFGVAALSMMTLAHADDAVVGNGTAASCDEAALDAGLAQLYPGATFPGGTLTFDCGPSPHAIAASTRKWLSYATVIDGGGLITLDGQLVTGILGIDGVDSRIELRGLVLINGNAVGEYGGGLHVQAGNFAQLSDVTIRDSRAQFSGGAIHAEAGAVLLLERTELLANSAAHGGGIAANGVVTIRHSRLAGNGASVDEGGGLQLWFGDLDVSDSNFSANGAKNGGAILLRGGEAHLRDVTIDQNVATERGGGIALYEDALLLGQDMVFTSNVADIGGALDVQGSDTGPSATLPVEGARAPFQRVRFESNSARLGGAIHVSGPPPGNGGNYGSLFMTRAVLLGNTASERGGALFGNGRHFIDKSRFEENDADYGGGIYLASGNDLAGPFPQRYTHLREVTVRANGATGCGGGINAEAASLLVLEEVNVSRNRADIGGGLCVASPLFPIQGSAVFDNEANFGGGLFAQLDGTTPSLWIFNATFRGNHAIGAGAGVAAGGNMLVASSSLANDRVEIQYSTIIGGSTGSPNAGSSIAATLTLPVQIENSVIVPDDDNGCVDGAFVSSGGNALRGSCYTGHGSDINVTEFAQLGLGVLNPGNAFVQHYLPHADSVLVDRVACDPLRVLDARDFPVAMDGNGDGNADCDTGAIERQVSEPPPPSLFSSGFEP